MTMGIFAGRGDVIVAMGLAWCVGIYMGWMARKLSEWAYRKLHRQ